MPKKIVKISLAVIFLAATGLFGLSQYTNYLLRDLTGTDDPEKALPLMDDLAKQAEEYYRGNILAAGMSFENFKNQCDRYPSESEWSIVFAIPMNKKLDCNDLTSDLTSYQNQRIESQNRKYRYTHNGDGYQITYLGNDEEIGGKGENKDVHATHTEIINFLKKTSYKDKLESN